MLRISAQGSRRCAPHASKTPQVTPAHSPATDPSLHFRPTRLPPMLTLIEIFALFDGQPAVLHQGANHEKRQNRQGRQTNFPVQRQPLQHAQRDINRQCQRKLFLTSHTSPECRENSGAQGWIRTTERRKGGQIYSLLALTAHPPVHVPILRCSVVRRHRGSEPKLKISKICLEHIIGRSRSHAPGTNARNTPPGHFVTGRSVWIARTARTLAPSRGSSTPL